MSYGKVKDTFWTDKKIRALDDDPKMLALYFLTGPHRNILGCMRVPNGYILDDLGWSSKRLADAIKTLCQCRFIARDDDGWTLIVNQLKHDPIGNKNHAAAAIRLAHAVPSDGPIFNAMSERLTCALDALGMASEWHPDAIAIPEPLPSPLPEPEPSPSPRAPDGAVSEVRPDFKSEFDAWWQGYPKKVDRGHALKAYTKARKTISAAALLTGLAKYAAEVAGKEPQYIKHAATWLNGQCWLDESTADVAARDRETFKREIEERLNAA